MAAAQRLWQIRRRRSDKWEEGDDFLEGGCQLDLAGGHNDAAVIISQWRAGRHERRTFSGPISRSFLPRTKKEKLERRMTI